MSGKGKSSPGWVTGIVFALFLVTSSAAEFEDVSIEFVGDWEVLYASRVEWGGSCIAVTTTDSARHFLALNGAEGDWSWMVIVRDFEAAAKGASNQLRFQFSNEIHFDMLAAVSPPQVTTTNLPRELVDSIGSTKNLSFILNGEHILDLDISEGDQLVALLNKCHRQHVSVYLEASSLFDNALELHDQGEHKKAIEEFLIVLELKKQALGETHLEVADVLALISSNYFEIGMHTEGQQFLADTLAIEEQILGDSHPRVINTRELIVLTKITYLKNQIGPKIAEDDYQAAIALQRETLAIVEDAWGPNDPRTIEEAYWLGNFLHTTHQFEESERFLSKAIAMGEETFKAQDQKLLPFRVTMALLYSDTGRFTEADLLLRKNLKIQEREFGPDHPQLLETLDFMMIIAKSHGRYSEAEYSAKRSLAIREKYLGSDNQEVAKSLNTLASIYIDLARYIEAKSLIDRAIAIQTNGLGPKHPDLNDSYENLAAFYFKQGFLRESIEAQLESERIVGENVGDLGIASLAFSRSQTAGLFLAAGKHVEAENRLLESLELFEKTLGPHYSGYLDSLLLLARCYQAQARYDEAERSYKRVLELGPSTQEAGAQVTNALSNLYAIYVSQNRLTEVEQVHEALSELPSQLVNYIALANVNDSYKNGNLADMLDAEKMSPWDESRYMRTLEETEHSFGPNFPDLAIVLDLLAIQCINRDCSNGDSETLMKRALSIREKAFGPKHFEVAKSYFLLAELNRYEGRYEESTEYYQNSVHISKVVLGPNHPDVAKSTFGLASLYSERQQKVEEQEQYHRLINILQSRINSGQNTGKERIYSLEYLKLLSRMKTSSPLGQSDALIAAQIARGESKGETFRMLGERIAQGGKSPLSKLIRQRQDMIHRVAALENRLIEAYDLESKERYEVIERLRNQLKEVREEEQEISRRLQREFPNYAVFEGSRLVTIEELQQVLEPDEAALAWLLGDEESYLLVVRSEGDLNLIGLNATEKEISSNVNSLHEALDLGNPEHQGELVAFPSAIAAELFKNLFGESWERTLAGIERLILVPEGPLTRLSFPALLTEPTGRKEIPAFSADYRTAPWLARRFSVSVVPTLSSITVLRNTSIKSDADKPFLGIGDPLLDDHPSKQLGVVGDYEMGGYTTVRQIRGVDEVQPKPANAFEMRLTRLERIRQQPSLPDTAVELQRVAKLLKASNDDLFLREKATEHNVKQTTLNQYRMVSFATHGVLAGEPGYGIEPGLILTPPGEPNDLDDGFLSLSEVAQLDLNAEWVVLSACNTAAGANSDNASEGLTGMAKAFAYAGAKAMLVSHWSVSSATTVELMETIIMSYSQNQQSRPEAHRQAMIDLIQSGDPIKSHPSIWAPFVVFGGG